MIKKIKAITIIETLVTLLAMSFMIAGPILFVSRSFAYASYLQNKMVANALSQEGLELITSLRNNSTTTFVSLVDATCLSSVCTIDWNGSSDTPSISTCQENNSSCRLYESQDNSITTLRHSTGMTPSKYFRAIKINKNGSAYTIESRVWSEEDAVFKTDITLKKILYAF